MTPSKTLPFYRQRDFWKDRSPVDIAEFVEGMLGMKPSAGQYEILYALAGRDPFEWDTSYQQYNLAIGQGGGKNTYIISPYTAYASYMIANMTDPWMYFSRFFNVPMDRGTRFEMTNSSMVTERQAKNVHFAKMQSLLRRCSTKDGRSWFEVYAGLDTRETFGDMQAKTISIPTRPGCGSIVLHSFDSTPTAPEGLHIILGIVDEASRADSEAKYLEMQRLWKVIVGNLNTRFPLGVGKVINFSYLSSSEYDFTYDLIRQAEEERKFTNRPIIFSVNRSTFDMNPNTKRTDPSIEKDYRTDPSDALARYEGIKGSPREGFYQPHVHKVKECFFQMESPVDYDFGVTERIVNNPQTGEKNVRRFVKVNLTRIVGDNRPRCWAFDPGVSIDAFILKGGYVETMDELKEEIFVENKPELITINKRPIIDTVIVWQPKDGLTVDMLNVGEVIGILLEKFPNSMSVTSDRYNSEKLSQEIMARGVHSETYHFSNAQQMRLYKTLRLLFWSNIPQIHSDMNHLVQKGGITKTVGEWNLAEHERLLKINENKVDHARDFSKDMSDVDAILCSDLQKLETRSIVVSISDLSNGELSNLTQRFRHERHILRSNLVPAVISKQDRYERLGKALGLAPDLVQRLEEHVDEHYPNEVWNAYLGWEKDISPFDQQVWEALFPREDESWL
ncbi:MAG: hypothetical protein Q8P51_03120 [Ignavibacteria bacterium]|nr:hypothetical protein [Ignavibacteria bacterium]